MPCRGVLFDLGVSSPQLDDPQRGFSFRADGPLDMRMDPTRGEPVSAWLARASVDEMRQVIATFGEERFARRVAQAIVDARGAAPLTRTAQLAALVAGAVRTREPGKHPATRTFQALRMFINDELGQLERGLHAALERARARRPPGGHQLPLARGPGGQALHAAPVRSSIRRLRGLPVMPASARPRLKLVGRKQRARRGRGRRNPRARSALLRVAEKQPMSRAALVHRRCRCCGWRRSARPPAPSTASIARASCSSQLEALNARRDNLEIEWGQLQLEQSAWSTHAFVERVASAKLHMAMPPPKEIEIIAP